MSRQDKSSGDNPTYDQPAAFDVQGRPLYYRPETADEASQQPTNAAESTKDNLPPELQEKHDESVRLYPEIHFSDHEYVVIDIERTIWGLIFIWLAALAIFAVILLFAVMMFKTAGADPFTMFVIVVGSAIICLFGGSIGHWIYRRNFFVVTNERIISRVQISPFSHHTQNVEIEHIEDCSHHQNGLIQTILNYGSIRLSTVGDEQTYRFSFVARPEEQFRIVNRVVQIVDEEPPTKYRD